MGRLDDLLTRYSLIVLGLISLLHSFILTKLIFFPFPELFLLPYLMNRGLVPYKDITDQHFPGLFFLPINAGNLGLANESIARIWLIVITISIHVLIFFITKAITKSPKTALLANFIFFLWHPFWGGWVLWIDTFMPIFLLPAFYLTHYILASKKSVNYKFVILLGFVFSLGTIMKQILLPLAAIIPLVLLIYFRNLKIIFYYMLGYLPLLIAVLFYLIKIGAFPEFSYWAGIYNFTLYIKMSHKGPEYPDLFQMIISYSPILFFPFIKDKKTAFLLSLFTFITVTGIVDRFDPVHFQPSLPFLSIGLSLIITQMLKAKKFQYYLYIYLIISAVWIYTDFGKYLSKEVIIFNDQAYKNRDMIKKYANPGDQIFIFGPTPLLYYLTQTIPAGKYFTFQMPWYSVITEDKSINKLKKSNFKLVARDKTFSVDNILITSFAPKLNRYIEDNFEVFDSLGNMELLRRRSVKIVQ